MYSSHDEKCCENFLPATLVWRHYTRTGGALGFEVNWPGEHKRR
jgi:hypothetical protein